MRIVMSLKRYALAALMMMSTLAVTAQDDDYVRPSKDDDTKKPKSVFWDRIYVGGGLGAQFGNVTMIDISPLVGYRVTDRFSAGLGITYQYFRIRDSGYTYSTSIYGGRTFARFAVFDFLFLHSEFEMLNWECPRLEPTGYTSERLWVPGLLLGGGLWQSFGDSGSGLYAMALYNVLYDDCSPYNSPLVLRIGVAFGL